MRGRQAQRLQVKGVNSVSMKRWLREPLLHFMFLGALLFATEGYFKSEFRMDDSARLLRLSSQDVQWLRETWSRQWLREPSEAELRGLVSDYLRECLLAREAVALGLEENDTIIRRRLAQKVEFLVQDTARLAEPTEAQLRGFFESHAASFVAPGRVTLTQLFFHREQAARSALAGLAEQETEAIGETTLLETKVTDAEPRQLAAQFGEGFAHAVFTLAPGSWQGPIASAYGFHLVYIEQSVAARPRSFEEVRAEVTERWRQEQQTQAKEQFFSRLLRKYDLVVDDSLRPLVSALHNPALPRDGEPQ